MFPHVVCGTSIVDSMTRVVATETVGGAVRLLLNLDGNRAVHAAAAPTLGQRLSLAWRDMAESWFAPQPHIQVHLGDGGRDLRAY